MIWFDEVSKEESEGIFDEISEESLEGELNVCLKRGSEINFEDEEGEKEDDFKTGVE
jgi:hypothetical protein